MTELRAVKYRHDYREPDYIITDISLEFVLDANVTTVTAVSQVIKKNKEEPLPLILDGEQLSLISIHIDGKSWDDYQVTDHQLIINHVPDQFSLMIVNQIHPDKNSALEGLYQSGEALCTQCEAEGFRRITYYLDRPDVLAKFRTKILADKKQYPILLSNGNRIEQGELADGTHWVVWEDPFPKPCYLFALVAGDFDILTDVFTRKSGRDVALEIYVDKGNLHRAHWAMQSLKKAMLWDEQRFNLEYDLDIYMIVAVDFFNMGAMENKGLNVFNAKFVLANTETATDKDYLNIEAVIGHEYFHNWTGNRITCRDWFQLSLKEGLTVFRDQEFSSDVGSRAVNRIENVRVIRGAQFAEDASPMAHPIRPDKVIEMNNFYTLTVYEKGAEVIRMLHTLLGEENFQTGMQRYIEKHDGQAVTCDDFVQAMEDASGIDLTLFRRWYQQSGTPLVTLQDHYDSKKKKYTLHVSQYTVPTADQREKLPLHIPLDLELYDNQGQVFPLKIEGKFVHSVLNVTEEQQTFIFEEVTEQPIPAFFRNFSAPVKLDYAFSDHQLAQLMKFARNDFDRWDASQKLLNKYLKQGVSDYQNHRDISLPASVLDAFRVVLLDRDIDLALAAQILMLPTENEISELFDEIDPDAIAAVRKAFIVQFAQEFSEEWLTVYNLTKSTEYSLAQSEVAKRSLHNVCLQYLAYDEPNLAESLITAQYYSADNMTNLLSALVAAVDAQLDCSDQLLFSFDEQWRHDGLVMDKWFALQATNNKVDALSHVKQLMSHPAFSLTNPNRVRALIGAFCLNNPSAFHCKDGAGYQFLFDILTHLNQSNPQIASRLIEPLIRFRRYDHERQELMKNVLEQLKNLNELSGDLFEKIDKALVIV